MITIILIVLALAVVGTIVATKFGFVKDDDKNGIPDVVDAKVVEAKEKVEEVKEKVEEVTKEVQKRAKRVKEEIGDVAKAVKTVGEQAKQVAKAAGGSPRKGRKPKQ